MKKRKIIIELKSKKVLSNEEMFEYIKLSPPNSFKLLPKADDLGIVDIEKYMENMNESIIKCQKAQKEGFYLEVISLRLQHLDIWLRSYWVAKNKKKKTITLDDKRTFGMLLNDCKNLKFDEIMHGKLKKFNDERVKGIHRYLLGESDYESLRIICEETTGIVKEVMKYITKEIGIPLSVT